MTEHERNCSCAGPSVARAWEAPSRDTLRGRAHEYEKRALDCAKPAPESGHTHEAQVTPCSMAEHWLAGGDQPLNGLDLIGKATLNVLESGGRREITNVEEKRLHVCHEHISFAQEIARHRQLRSGRYIQRLNLRMVMCPP